MAEPVYEIEDAECIHETALAVLIEAPEFPERVWIPKSVLSEASEVAATGDSGWCIVALWFAEKQGWSE